MKRFSCSFLEGVF